MDSESPWESAVQQHAQDIIRLQQLLDSTRAEMQQQIQQQVQQQVAQQMANFHQPWMYAPPVPQQGGFFPRPIPQQSGFFRPLGSPNRDPPPVPQQSGLQPQGSQIRDPVFSQQSNVSQDFDEVRGQQTPKPTPQPASQLPRTELDLNEEFDDGEIAMRKAMEEAQDQAGDLDYTTSITEESDTIDFSDDELGR